MLISRVAVLASQRKYEMNECMSVLIRKDFRLVVLCGFITLYAFYVNMYRSSKVEDNLKL